MIKAEFHSASESDPQPTANGTGYQPRRLVLLGAGLAHLQLLSALAKGPLVSVRTVLIAPGAAPLYPPMVAGMLSGHYAPEACSIALEPLVRQSGVHWLRRSVRALHANAKSVELDDGSTLAYDWLSINTGLVQNRATREQSLPGAREHGLFLRPLEAFETIWPQVSRMADARGLRIGVIGGGATGIELAFALRQRFPHCSLTLLSDGAPMAKAPAAFQQRIVAALRQRNITLLREPVIGLRAGELTLSSGARLACDIPLLCTGAEAPQWLAGSELALDAHGFVQIDNKLRSNSHPEVFACGDIASLPQPGPEALPRNLAQALRAGPTLYRNLSALVSARPLKPHRPARPSLQLIGLGDGRALASWGRWTLQGRLAWWFKSWRDRRQIGRLRGV